MHSCVVVADAAADARIMVLLPRENVPLFLLFFPPTMYNLTVITTIITTCTLLWFPSCIHINMRLSVSCVTHLALVDDMHDHH